jgi:hypothetical protein
MGNDLLRILRCFARPYGRVEAFPKPFFYR